VSPRPFDRAGVADELRQWSLVADDLVERGVLSDADGARVRWLGLAPVYDMLPMFYAPRHAGELPRRPFHPSTQADTWPVGVRDAARVFWRRVADDPRISEAFRAIAGEHGA